jgi:hypothetical protein
LPPAERAELDEVRQAIHDDLLPPLDRRATVPAELVDLTARLALEHRRLTPGVRALREADSLDRFYESYRGFALEALEAGDLPRAAYELTLAGRLGWARADGAERIEFVLGLGVSAGELAGALGAESARGKISGGRGLPDFPAWQIYGPLLHARCHLEGCLCDRSLEANAPVAIRFLLHDPDLAQRALALVQDPLPLLRALAAEVDPALASFAERHAQAALKYRELHDRKLIRDTRLQKRDAEEPGEPADQETPAGEDAPTEAAAKAAEEAQSLLLGRQEKQWRNCLSELAGRHPLSVLAVCAVRNYDLGGFVIPAGEAATAFLKAVTGRE